MALDTVDKVVAALAEAGMIPIFLPSVTTVAGRLTNLQKAGTGGWGLMATPAVIGSSGTLHVDSDAGFPAFSNPTGGELTYLGLAAPSVQTVGSLLIYDRVWSCSGMSGTSAVAQNIISFPALTRPDSSGTGLQMFAEIYTQIGATGTTITASYTNSANTSGRTTVAQSIGNTGLREVHRMIPMPLQAGDTGVKSIASATLAATTGTAGDFGLTLGKLIAVLPCTVAGANPPFDWSQLGLPPVSDDAALNFILQASTTSSGLMYGGFKLIQG